MPEPPARRRRRVHDFILHEHLLAVGEKLDATLHLRHASDVVAQIPDRETALAVLRGLVIQQRRIRRIPDAIRIRGRIHDEAVVPLRTPAVVVPAIRTVWIRRGDVVIRHAVVLAAKIHKPLHAAGAELKGAALQMPVAVIRAAHAADESRLRVRPVLTHRHHLREVTARTVCRPAERHVGIEAGRRGRKRRLGQSQRIERTVADLAAVIKSLQRIETPRKPVRPANRRLAARAHIGEGETLAIVARDGQRLLRRRRHTHDPAETKGAAQRHLQCRHRLTKTPLGKDAVVRAFIPSARVNVPLVHLRCQP